MVYGKDKTVKLLKTFINNIEDKYQIIAIAGKNKKIEEQFKETATNQKDIHVYGYSKNIPELMSISDLVVTKPGGLTVTESLASGLPIVVINPIPGQEEQNAEYLENEGVAIWIKKHQNENETIKNLLNNQTKLKHMKIKSKITAKQNSCKDICKIILGPI